MAPGQIERRGYKDIEELDIMDNLGFDKRVREIMEAHTEEPSVNSWNLITSGLQRRRDARIRRIRRSIYVYSAAAALLLFMLINPWIFSDNENVKIKENILSHDLFMKRMPKVAIAENIKRPAGVIVGHNRRVVGIGNYENLISGEVHEIDPKAVEIEEKQVEITQKEEVQKQAENRVSENRPDDRVVRNVLGNTLLENRSDKSVGGKPVLALSTGISPPSSGAYTPSLMRASSYDGANNVNPVFSSARAPHESVFHGEEYMIPVTIGIHIFFPITDRFSVGTGINYSILSTKYNVTSMNTTERRQVTIHYGGVPLNFQYNIYSANRLNFYALAGTTIEKGLTAVDKNMTDGSLIDERDEISGIQLSASAGLGVEYAIFNSIGLYFDPNITYYFDNKKKPQPFSIRTIQPLLFRFEAGVRFRL